MSPNGGRFKKKEKNDTFLLVNLYASSKKSKAQQLWRINEFRKEGKLKKYPTKLRNETKAEPAL